MLVFATPRSNMTRAATPTIWARVASPLRVNRDVLSSFTLPSSACREAAAQVERLCRRGR
jgi:hypothetical protein